MRSHKDLVVWQAAMDLAEAVYVSARAFPREEQYGLAAQLRGCSASIPSNIAEGAGRQGNKEFLQFLHYALGSSAELETQLELSRRVGVLSHNEFERLDKKLFGIRQLLRGLISSVSER